MRQPSVKLSLAGNEHKVVIPEDEPHPAGEYVSHS
jgi:hypothetical protein